jgi:Holliday junction DNA helicase RuvA
MIALLRGTIVRRSPNRLIVEAGGVGYDVQIPLSTFYALSADSRDVVLEIHTQVREDAISLFGFHTIEEKRLFEHLIGVSGIGPKLACTVLSGLPPAEIVSAISRGDAARLTKIPGVGRKTAERMLVELKDKVTDLSPEAATPVRAPGDPLSVRDAVSALVNLGYREESARAAVSRAASRAGPDAPPVDVLLKDALRILSEGARS